MSKDSTELSTKEKSDGIAPVAQTPRKILIAGCGDLGLRVASCLLKDPSNEVWGVRRQPPEPEFDDSSTTSTKRLRWFKADLTDPASLQQLPADWTHVIYAAAADARNEQAYRAIYLEGLQNAVTVCRSAQLQKILFVSSTAVYGDHGDAWVDESTATDPQSFNGRIIVEAENWLANQTDIACTIRLRLSGIYGPGRHYLINKLKSGLVSAPAENEHWVNRIHIDDAARAIVHLSALEKTENLYLITDSHPLPMRTLYESVARMVGGPVPPQGPAPASVGSKRLSNARLLASGFSLQWPDSRSGHQALIHQANSTDS